VIVPLVTAAGDPVLTLATAFSRDAPVPQPPNAPPSITGMLPDGVITYGWVSAMYPPFGENAATVHVTAMFC
jgi:hypothetical protein